MLEKIAQTSQTNQATLPTDQTAATTTVPPPPSFIASSIYPGIRYGFNPQSVQIINRLVSLLNNSVHYASSGAVNFQVFRNDNFNFDASQAPSVDQRNLMNLSKRVYHTFLNNGNPFSQQLTPAQVTDMADKVLTAPEYNNLSQLNPTGALATKIQGNLKTLIYDTLTYLKLANPITAQR